MYTKILREAEAGYRIDADEALELFKTAPLPELGWTADLLRRKKHSQQKPVTFVVDRNINYTNACTAACRFCAFAYWPGDDNAYTLPYETISNKISELVATGGTQILLQGGHNPQLKIEYYEDLFERIKVDFPTVCLHALSPSEIDHICEVSHLPLEVVIERLMKAGWYSLPGGGAEILVDRVRNILSPLKTTADRWLEIMRVAHTMGVKGSATMMFGHVETFAERVEHLQRLRNLQDETGGFRAFICWTFQPGNTPLSKDPQLALGEGTGDAHDYLRTQAISRIFLDNFDNIQASWVTQGFEVGQMALHFGANDFGGTMMEENVVSAAGNTSGKSSVDELVYQINKAGFEAAQRDTNYNLIRTFERLSA